MARERAARLWTRLPARARTLRVRTTAAATLVVAVALVLGAVLVDEVQARTLTAAMDDSLGLRADDITASLADGSLPRELSVRDSEEALVQVVGSDGAVVAASANIHGEDVLAGFTPVGRRQFRTLPALPISGGPFRVLAQRVALPDQQYVIYVAQSLEDVQQSIAVLRRMLVVAVPTLVLVVGGLTWVVVGRALSPVEAIRTEVAAITGSDLHRRVPEPRDDDEIGRLARTMNEMLVRLEAAQEQQQRFIADASHELRSPIAGIRAQLEVDLARPDQAQPLETERAVLDEVLRLERLASDLLQLARSDSTRALETGPVDLDDIVFREIEQVRARGGVAVDSSAVSGAQVNGDRDLLMRAVRNLLDNAVRYARTRVGVSLSEDANRATLSVEDDGPGIPPDASDRVFERFTRLDEARSRDAGGAGLGLAIAREIIERHGGTIGVDPDYATGARFVVQLPSGT